MRALIEAFLVPSSGELDTEEFVAAQDAAIVEVVAEQEHHGLSVVTGGRLRRLSWQTSFWEVDGWELWSGSRWRHSRIRRCERHTKR